MNEAEKIQQLTEQFRLLGAFNPEVWARSQVQEGIPQYSRFVFLREMWKRVVRESDISWIEPTIRHAERNPQDPGASIGPILSRMLAAGVSPKDITELVRVMQWKTLADIADLLDDSGMVGYPSKDMPRVHWALFEVSEDEEPLHTIGCLHESVLEVEPTGREMRPKVSPDQDDGSSANA
jgi:hypothetical protein